MVKWVADIGSNHNKDLDRCLDLIRIAKSIGCWGVKFQLFKAEKLYAPEFVNHIAEAKQCELPIEFIQPIKEKCQELKIKFICTPFDLESLEQLIGHVDILKIGSYELLHLELIQAVAKTKIPWILSIGMKKIMEVRRALETSSPFQPDYILHCNSNYPAEVQNCNLSGISDKLQFYSKHHLNLMLVKIGWSDHSVSPAIIYRAVALGAQMIEFHFDLDGKGLESKHGHCWDPHWIQEVIKTVNNGFLADYGNENVEQIRKWRTDPVDGMRPLRQYRKELLSK